MGKLHIFYILYYRPIAFLILQVREDESLGEYIPDHAAFFLAFIYGDGQQLLRDQKQRIFKRF